MRKALPSLLLVLLLPLTLSHLQKQDSDSRDPADALFTSLQQADLQRHLHELLNPHDSSEHAERLLHLAEEHAENNDPVSALRVLRLSAVLGSTHAHSSIAALLLVGESDVQRDVSAAVHHLRIAASRGHADSQALLGLLYASGIADRHGVEKNLHKALLNWAFAAAGGNVYGTTALAFRYMHGIGVPKSCEIAAKYYQRAANAIATDPRHWPSAENFVRGKPPLPSTLRDSGRLRLDEGILEGTEELVTDETDLIQFQRHSAEKGDVRAMTTLGGLHFFGGYGLEPDEGAARDILERAADLNDAEAHGILGHLAMRNGDNQTAILRFRYSAGGNSRMGHYALGMIFFHGLLGMEKDYSKANMHFTLATEQEHGSASFHLGLIHWRGLGVEKNQEMAFRHFQDGARLGNIQSKLNVGSILLEGARPVRQKDCQQAIKYLKAVAEEGEWRGVFDLAVSAMDEKEWYRTLYRHLQAAYAGIELGQYNAAMLLERVNKTSFPELQHWDRERFLQEAHELYDYSGIQGYTDAFIRSANVRYDERKEHAEAARTYEKAAQMNNTEGMVTLALLHARGLGIPENRPLAMSYLKKAGRYADGELPAFVARVGLWFYWSFSDIYKQFALMFMQPPENRLVARPPTQQAITGSESQRRSTGVGVVRSMEIMEELVIVGALFAVLFTVLVVRSKRMARQQAEQQRR